MREPSPPGPLRTVKGRPGARQTFVVSIGGNNAVAVSPYRRMFRGCLTVAGGGRCAFCAAVAERCGEAPRPRDRETDMECPSGALTKRHRTDPNIAESRASCCLSGSGFGAVMCGHKP